MLNNGPSGIANGLLNMLQIAIIGDKASGKTSVFEALTGLSFSAAKRPLTNFAIHAQFKRTPGETPKVKAHLRAGPLDARDGAAVKHLESFEKTHEGAFTGDDFIAILHEAAKHMEITVGGSDSTDSDSEGDSQRQLSDNLLVLEISGPDVHSLSVIDFPGLMHSMFSFNFIMD